jgi:hypothetical protein
MRRFMTTTLIAASVLVGSLSLNGCIVVPPRDHGYVGHHRDHDRRHDNDRHHDRDRDRDRDGDRWH